MRRLAILLTLALLTSLSASDAKAQFFGEGNFNDPFFQYYGFYLPRQAALAAQPRPQESINALAAARQYNAMTERAGLYDPIQPFGEFGSDGQLFDRRRRGGYGGMASLGANGNGNGPTGYYNRTHTYFPGLRSGRTAAGPQRLSTYNPRRPQNWGGMGGLGGWGF